MLFKVAKVGNIRFKRCAAAKIFRLNFAKIDTCARHDKGGEKSHAAHQGKVYEPLAPQGNSRIFMNFTVNVRTWQRLSPGWCTLRILDAQFSKELW